jgi:ankyrin repeat protein
MDIFNLLLEQRADPYLQNKEFSTPIDEVVRHGHRDLLTCIYPLAKKQKRDLNQEGSLSFLHLAAVSEDAECLKFLVDAKSNFNITNNNTDMLTPLHLATSLGYIENVKLLLKAQASINTKDCNGNTPYHGAVLSKNIALVKIFEQRTGNAKVKNEKGETPIDIAMSMGHSEIFNYLMSQPKYEGYDP